MSSDQQDARDSAPPSGPRDGSGRAHASGDGGERLPFRADESGHCDLCQSTEAELVFETGERRYGLGGRFTILRCLICGLARTDPQPDDLGSFYPAAEYYSYRAPRVPSAMARARARSFYGHLGDGSASRALLSRIARRRLSPGLPPLPPGRILDVGCGSGAALLLFAAAGWEPYGVEIDAAAIRAARGAGLRNVHHGDLVSAGYDGQMFDAVRFWHSLEHVRSPRRDLEEAKRILRPGGVLVLGVPNFASLLARAAREHWFYLDVPRHLWHFDRSTLTHLAQKCGFRDIRTAYVTTPTPLLGTIDFLRGRGERLVRNRALWFLGFPLAVVLDLIRLGDGLELTAYAPSRSSHSATRCQ